MTRLDQSTGRLSLRNSILVWVAGIVIGWGCAVVLFYQLIRDSTEEGRLGNAQLVAEAHDTVGVADIEPAAGPVAPQQIDQRQSASDRTADTQNLPKGS